MLLFVSQYQLSLITTAFRIEGQSPYFLLSRFLETPSEIRFGSVTEWLKDQILRMYECVATKLNDTHHPKRTCEHVLPSSKNKSTISIVAGG